MFHIITFIQERCTWTTSICTQATNNKISFKRRSTEQYTLAATLRPRMCWWYCRKGHISHAKAWQVWPFWQDTSDVRLAQKGEPRSIVCTYSRNIMNDDDHDIPRVHYFSTVCVNNESYSYVTSLFTVALALGWNPLTTWGVNWNEQQHSNGSNQMAQIKLGPRLHGRPAQAGLWHCVYLCTYNFTHSRVMVPIALPELH